MQIFGIAGWSGSGKTTMLANLVPALMARGFSVSSIKQANPSFDIDQPGKDSFQHRMAGCREVLVVSERRWAMMHELRREPMPSLDDLVRKMTPLDIVLVEGFRRDAHPKLEVHRKSVGKPLIAPEDPSVVAVASDQPLSGLTIPRFSIDDIAAIAGFVATYLGLDGRTPSSPEPLLQASAAS